MKDKIKKYGLGNIGILFFGFLILIIGDLITFFLFPEFNSNQTYWYTLMAYARFFSLWISLLVAIYLVKKRSFYF